jgi:hypothetical protein
MKKINWNCADCGMNTFYEYYMVHDELWDSVSKSEEMLCILCLEARLGFKLSKKDFTDCPINKDLWIDSTKILKNRLKRKCK